MQRFQNTFKIFVLLFFTNICDLLQYIRFGLVCIYCQMSNNQKSSLILKKSPNQSHQSVNMKSFKYIQKRFNKLFLLSKCLKFTSLFLIPLLIPWSAGAKSSEYFQNLCLIVFTNINDLLRWIYCQMSKNR